MSQGTQVSFPHWRENSWVSLWSSLLPLETFPKAHILLGVECAAGELAFRLTFTSGVWRVIGQWIVEGKGTQHEKFLRWKYFPENTTSVCSRCQYNWPSVLSWSWEWIFYRKKEMHGCGAASGKGSFQETCLGSIYRHKSLKGCSRAGERVWFVGCGAWHLAFVHADLACICTCITPPTLTPRSSFWAVGMKRAERKCTHPEGK